jgi:lipopolysaccharide transport system ATP-binding protein
MSADTAISIRNLGKSYILSHQKVSSYNTFSESLLGMLGRLIVPGEKKNKGTQENFWSLENISFEVKRGEVIGIIGKNGAGKSTLLKILSRITEPTTGHAEIYGRVGSLLEVGTGFHPELTGRENIYLNGTLLGMRKRQIDKVFAEIVEFAEISRFIDTPVKRYSSGMYVRLAFAVAAHIQPEVMIVDEVLAVGDLAFQEKCLGKMRNIGSSGRTILFVSHNMEAVQALCTRAIVIHHGKICFDGAPIDAKEYYMREIVQKEYSIENNSGRGGSGGGKIISVDCVSENGYVANHIRLNESIKIKVEGEVSKEFIKSREIDVAIGLESISGIRVATILSSWKKCVTEIRNDKFGIEFHIFNLPLVPGQYVVSASLILKGETLDCIQRCASFNILPEQGVHIERSSDWGQVNLSYNAVNII